tara:strand:+ start:135 stop:536 length:402 start_codon:yes stop_codon:yes gene_type:complete
VTKIIKQFNLNTPSWEELLSNLNFSFIHDEFFEHSSTGFFLTLSAFKIETVQKTLKKLGLQHAHLYINIVNSETFGPHKDECDVWFWQVKGQTIWEVENEQFNLEEGDLIFVPKGIIHNIIPLGPRAGISMSK